MILLEAVENSVEAEREELAVVLVVVVACNRIAVLEDALCACKDHRTQEVVDVRRRVACSVFDPLLALCEIAGDSYRSLTRALRKCRADRSLEALDKTLVGVRAGVRECKQRAGQAVVEDACGISQRLSRKSVKGVAGKE